MTGERNGWRQMSAGGSVLILALWVVFFLAALTLATGAHVAAVLGAAERLTLRTRVQAEASGAAAYAAAVIMSQTNAWDGLPAKAWNRDERVFGNADVSGVRFSVAFASPESGGTVRRTGVIGEEGRININRASPRLLATFLTMAAGMGLPDAESLAAAIVAWRGGSDEMLTGGEGSGYYSDTTGGGLSKGRPLRSTEELLLIKGVDEDLFHRIEPFITVYGSGLVNINAASATVLESLGVSLSGAAASGAAAASLAARIVRYREAGNAFEKAEYLAIRTALERFDPLTGDEGTVFTAMAGALAVRSTSFGGTAYGGGEHAEGGPAVLVDFVWDAQTRRFVMWRER